MEEMVLTIRADDLRKTIGSRPFLALPQEEIDRLYASIEVFVTERNLAEDDSSLMQLVAFIAIHHNYSWLTCNGEFDHAAGITNTPSIGFDGHIHPDGHNDLFLDDSLKNTALKILNSKVVIEAGYDLRLAGLLYDDATQFGKKHLGLVYIARLHQPGVVDRSGGAAKIRFCGVGELIQGRERFESWSKILVDHLVAL